MSKLEMFAWAGILLVKYVKKMCEVYLFVFLRFDNVAKQDH